MKFTLLILLLYCAVVLTNADEEETRDLLSDGEDSEDLERKHRKRKKHGGQNSPCGYGGFGKTFGSHDTYVSAPVMNYFLCGVAPVPVVPQYAPLQVGHGHGGHGHGGHGNHGNHGGHGGYGVPGGFGGYGGPFGGPVRPGFYGNQGYYPQYNQFNPQNGYNQYQPEQFNRPFQNAVSAAASGFGNALADYITRPRKTQKQINQFLKPLYKLF